MSWFWKRMCAYVTRLVSFAVGVFAGKATLMLMVLKVHPLVYSLPFAAKTLLAIWSAAFWTWLVCFYVVCVIYYMWVEQLLHNLGWTR